MESRWSILFTTKVLSVSSARDEAYEAVRDTGFNQALRVREEDSIVTMKPLFCIFLMKPWWLIVTEAVTSGFCFQAHWCCVVPVSLRPTLPRRHNWLRRYSPHHLKEQAKTTAVKKVGYTSQKNRDPMLHERPTWLPEGQCPTWTETPYQIRGHSGH